MVSVSRLAPRVLIIGLEKIESSSSSRCSVMDSGGDGELPLVSASDTVVGDKTVSGMGTVFGLASSSWLRLTGLGVFTAGL